MLKKITSDRLTLGMHIKEFCGSWMDHPFWRGGFVLNNPKDLATIQASNIKEVWIDSSRGKDVVERRREAETVCPPVPERRSQSESSAEAKPRSVAPTSRAVELVQASRIFSESRQAVISMFQEARMGNAVDTIVAKALVEDIADSVSRNAGALISLARLKNADDYTYMHSVAVCAMMVALSRQLGLDQEQTRSAGLAGLMHDLGKAAMPLDVLNKPGKLTDAEYAVIKTHPKQGHNLLERSGEENAIVLDVCLHHHEKIDGSGYPKGLKGDEISLFAKMGAVCDVYDAITSNRPYKAGWDPAESLRKMAEWKGHFDLKVFQAFVKSLGIYPIGSLVRLSSGRLGVVVAQTGKSLTMPTVKVFYSTKSDLRIEPEVIELSKPGVREKIVQREDPAKWGFSDLNALWASPT